jgi:hypothetical protein
MHVNLTDRVATLEARLRDLLAEQEIHAVLDRYARAADRCDVELMKSCYHPDAIDDHGFFSGNGWKFCEFVVEQLRKLVLSVHSISNCIVTIDGEQAFVESHYAVIHRLKTFLGYTDYFHHGRYLDVFELRDRMWRIKTRIVCQDGERWLQTANLTRIVSLNPNLPVQGQQNRSDPVYLGFDVGKLIKPRPLLSDIWGGFYRLAITPLIIVRICAIILTFFYSRFPTRLPVSPKRSEN